MALNLEASGGADVLGAIVIKRGDGFGLVLLSWTSDLVLCFRSAALFLTVI